MPVIVNLDVVLAQRKVRSKELAEAIGITESNLSLLKSGKVKGVRFSISFWTSSVSWKFTSRRKVIERKTGT